MTEPAKLSKAQLAEDRIKVKTTLEAMIPQGKSLNDFNHAVLLALGHYAKEVDPSWQGAGFKSIETRVRK